MKQKIPVAGDFYKQEDGRLCQVRAVAKNSADSKLMVVYQLMYEPFEMFVMPLDDFLADRKDGNGSGRHFFVKAEQPGEMFSAGNGGDSVSIQENKYKNSSAGSQMQAACSVTDEEFHRVLLTGKLDRYFHGKLTDEQIAERGFIELLDAENCNQKIEIFTALKPYLTKRMMENFAVTLDLALDEGDEEKYFEEILYCLRTMKKYEGGHLRGH